MAAEDVLVRWCGSKRGAREGNDAPAPARQTEPQSPAAPLRTADDPASAEVDLSNLPPIESITAVACLTAVLAQGLSPRISPHPPPRAWAAGPLPLAVLGPARQAYEALNPPTLAPVLP